MSGRSAATNSSMMQLEAFEAFVDIALSRRKRRHTRSKPALPEINKQSLPSCSGLMVSVPEFMCGFAPKQRYSTHLIDDRVSTRVNADQTVPEVTMANEQQFLEKEQQLSENVVLKHESLTGEYSNAPVLPSGPAALECDPLVVNNSSSSCHLPQNADDVVKDRAGGRYVAGTLGNSMKQSRKQTSSAVCDVPPFFCSSHHRMISPPKRRANVFEAYKFRRVPHSSIY